MTEDIFRERVIAMRDDFERRRALIDGASVCDDVLGLFEQLVATREQVVVTPVEGEAIGGYHRESLTRMVRLGQLPDLRPQGSKGRIYIPLSVLPMKPGHKRPDTLAVTKLADRMFGAAPGGKRRDA